jgi:hypothetical protein
MVEDAIPGTSAVDAIKLNSGVVTDISFVLADITPNSFDGLGRETLVSHAAIQPRAIGAIF